MWPSVWNVRAEHRHCAGFILNFSDKEVGGVRWGMVDAAGVDGDSAGVWRIFTGAKYTICGVLLDVASLHQDEF